MKLERSLAGLFTDLVRVHYGFVHTFETHDTYKYKGKNILYNEDKDIYILNYTLTTNTEEYYEPRDSYGSDPIFNQEPRILEVG